MPSDFISELQWRGLVHQITDETGLRAHLASGTRRAYVGYDPTADSLTIGNLVTIMMLRHFQEAGHTPVVVCGGGTGLIGDPSGKSAERELLTEDRVRSNVESQKTIFSRLLDFSGPRPAQMVNNLDWLGGLGYIQVLRDVGKYFSVNEMVERDSVRDRLARAHGISYTEFSYILLQAYDFLHLYRAHGVTLQMGGSDQFGNIVSGIALIRNMGIETLARMGMLADRQARSESEGRPPDPSDRDELEGLVSTFTNAGNWSPPAIATGGLTGQATSQLSREAIQILESNNRRFALARGGWDSFGLVCPLVTKADGGKFGKTESGAIWLTARRGEGDTSTSRTSPYAYYQFWLNASDADVGKFLRIFTLLPREQIEALEAQQQYDPGARAAQRALAREATALLHGATERDHAEAAAVALFSGDIAALPLHTLNEVLSAAPTSNHPKSQLEGDGVPLIDILAGTLCKSKSEARQALADNSISVNGRKVGASERLCVKDLLHGSIIALRRGKKNWHVTRWG
jgi:tyrosyl-tRNA synthetase